MSAKTTTWYVGYIWETKSNNGRLPIKSYPVVLVSAKPFPEYLHCRTRARIRTISPKAAGRKYIRCNLESEIVSIDYESYVYAERASKEEIKQSRKWRDYRKLATIRIIK